MPSANKSAPAKSKPSAKAKRPARGKAAPVDDTVDEAVAEPVKASPRASERESLTKRLPEMTDYQLQAYLGSALKFAQDPAHHKHASAKLDLPKIENEIRRRVTSGAARTPGRAPIPSPKQGKK